MNQVTKLNQLKDFSYFNRATLGQIIKISKKSLYENIARWIKKGKIIQLKKGLYVTKQYYQTLEDKEAYTEFISNKLRYPSYLSLEYILAKNGILTESVYSLTSITLKAKAKYTNKLANFIYRNIKKELFVGYKTISKGGFQIKQAAKSKALFDYLYLKLYRISKFDKNLIESLRLNLDEFSSKNIQEFKKYCLLTNINKFKKLPELLF